MTLKERVVWKLYTLSKIPVNRFLIFLDQLADVDFYRSVTYQLKDGSDYECTHLRLHGMLKKVCREAGGEDSILDVGCGKGRMLLFFSKYSFCRVDGIEYNPEIAAIAESNMKKLRLKSRVFLMDAFDFTQWDQYNWFYFYNPFPDRVMDICLHKMIKSLETNPRTLHIIYINPVCHSLLLNHGFIEVPAEYSLWEKLWFPNMRALKRYRYDPATMG